MGNTPAIGTCIQSCESYGASTGRYHYCDAANILQCNMYIACAYSGSSSTTTGITTCLEGTFYDDYSGYCVSDSRTCSAAEVSGDPHLKRYGTNQDLFLNGACWYTLFTDMDCPDGRGQFRITSNFQSRGKVTFLRELEILYKQEKIKLEQGPMVTFGMQDDNQTYITEFPFTNENGDVVIYKHMPPLPEQIHRIYKVQQPILDVVIQGGDIRMLWNGHTHVDVHIDHETLGPFCGLGGQNYGDFYDLIIGPHANTTDTECPDKMVNKPVGSTTKRIHEMANSWFYGIDHSDAVCRKQCLGTYRKK